MYKSIGFFLAGFLFLNTAAAVFGGGTAEEQPAAPLNGEWTLCLTTLDVSALSSGQRIVGELVARDLYRALLAVDRRSRRDDEDAYYRDYAWSKA
jgi:hypothetical protein